MSYYTKYKEIILGTIGALVVIFLGLVLPLILSPQLSLLEKIDYPYITNFFLKVDKKKCKNRLCSKVFYEKFKEEYKNLNK